MKKDSRKLESAVGSLFIHYMMICRALLRVEIKRIVNRNSGRSIEMMVSCPRHNKTPSPGAHVKA